MEKYTYLKELTKTFLHGDLSEIKVRYENSVYTVVDINYTDDSHYNFDYKFEVENMTNKIKFISHICDYANEAFELKRETKFEDAVNSFLFST